MQNIKKYLITGLLIWIPLAVTAWVIVVLVQSLDATLHLLPATWQKEVENIPGLGVILTFAVLFITGLLATNFLGQRILSWWDALLQRIPVVKSIYSSVKQVSDTLLAGNGQAFRQALLVQYPHQNSWTVAFLTGTPDQDILKLLEGDYISVYVPTTPNPTSGFMLIVPKADTKPLDMSVDAALKYVISLGVVPNRPQQN